MFECHELCSCWTFRPLLFTASCAFLIITDHRFTFHRLYARVTEAWDAGELVLMLRGLKLRNTEGFFAKADPFYEIHKEEEGEWYVSLNCYV